MIVSKAFGRDINNYYNNYFPEDGYLEETGDLFEEWLDRYENYEQNNDEMILALPNDEKFELNQFGVIYSNNTSEPIGSFPSLFKRWLKQQSTATVAIEVPKEEVEGIVKMLKDMGLKVVK